MSLPDSGGESAAGFVLAGGQSSRMGRDKALAELAGQLLVTRALGILREAGLSAEIAGARSPLDNYAPVVEDATAGLGPLGGICAAMASTQARHAAFLSVDMPLLPASLIVYLLRHAQITGAAVTVPSVNGFAQTFPVVVDRAVLPLLETSLQSGRGGCFAALQAAADKLGRLFSILPVELLAQPGHVAHPACLPAALWFLNVNGPVELARAERLHTEFYRVS